MQDGHVIPGLIHKAFIAKEKGEPLVVCGSGKALRQFIYSEDLAKVTNEQVARMIADAFGIEQGIVLDTTKSDGQMKKTASNAKLRRYLPDFQFTPLKEAIETTVDWFIKNHHDGAVVRK